MKLVFKIWTVLIAITVYGSLNESSGQTITFTYDANGNCTSKQINGTKPNVLITGDTLVCHGAVAKFTASGATNYQWDIGSSNNAISIIADTSKFYSVIGYSQNGCADTAKHFLTVVPVPKTDSIIGDTLAAVNSLDTFWAQQYHPGSTYFWSVTKGAILSGNGTDTVTMQWGTSPGKGIVEVYETVQNNLCKGIPVSKTVNLVYPVTVKDVHAAGILKVYPNPTSNGVHIEFTAPQKDDFILSVTSVDGRVVYRRALPNTDNSKLFIEDDVFKVSGVYTVTIRSATSEIFEKVVYSKK